eukprot:gene11269-1778_t
MPLRRLCPKDQAGKAGAETECFQKHVMEFHGDTQFI